MATIAQALAQSISGLYREVAEALPPGSMALAPPAEVESTAGEFQVVTAPGFPSRQTPVGVGPPAQHPTGILTFARVAFSIGDPFLAPAYPITDRELTALTTANRSLDPTRVSVNAIRRYLYDQHMQSSVTAAAGFTAGTSIDVSVQSTDLFTILQDARRAICNARGLDHNTTRVVFVANRAAVQRMTQFDCVMQGPAIGVGTTGDAVRRLGTVPPDYLATWLRTMLNIELVVDDTLHLSTAGTLTYTQSLAYLAVAEGGTGWSALKTLYVPMTDAQFTDESREAGSIESGGLLRLNVTRNAGAQQAGWTIKGDGQWGVTVFDLSLGRKFTLSNVPAA